MDFIANTEQLQLHIDCLIAAHPLFAKALSECGEYPAMRIAAPGFLGLAEIIVSQQISKSAAHIIFARLRKACDANTANDPAQAFLLLPPEEKRACGLSRQKIKYLNGVAEVCLAGALNPDELARMDNAALISCLTSLPGFGVWSAEIYALFVLRRGDIFPAADLALQESYRRLCKLPERPNNKQLREMVAQYAPHRSAAARLLWHYYRVAPEE